MGKPTEQTSGQVRRQGAQGRMSPVWPSPGGGSWSGKALVDPSHSRGSCGALAQATLSTEFIVLGFLGQGFYLAWDLWHLLLMNVYS